MCQTIQQKREVNPTVAAVVLLQQLGFPMANIRKSLHKLTGISQPDMARLIGTSRQNITGHMEGWRKTRTVQEGIAQTRGV